MKLVVAAALCALAGAARLDARYLPPVPGGTLAADDGGGHPYVGPLQPMRRRPGSAPHVPPLFFGDGSTAQRHQGSSTDPEKVSEAFLTNDPAQRFSDERRPSPAFQSDRAASRKFYGPTQGYHRSNDPLQRSHEADKFLQGSLRPNPLFQGLGTTRQSFGSRESKVPSRVFPKFQKQTKNGIGSNAPSQGFDSVNKFSHTFNDGFDAPNSVFPTSTGPAGIYDTPEGSGEVAAYTPIQRGQAAQERAASNLRQDYQNDGDTFSYSYETSDGISAEASGTAAGGVRAQGAFSYPGDDGQQYSVTYTADELGYRPQGAHIHPAILRALDRTAAAAAGDFDDEYDAEAERKYDTGAAASGQRTGGRPPPAQFNGRGGSQQRQPGPRYTSPRADDFPQGHGGGGAASTSDARGGDGGGGARYRPHGDVGAGAIGGAAFPAARRPSSFDSRDGYSY